MVPDKNISWVADHSFNIGAIKITNLTTTQENQLINISCGSNLKGDFNESSLCSFWSGF